MTKIGIVWSEFNSDITERMLESAKKHAEIIGLEIADIIKVPGAFDMPLAIKKLLENDKINGVVTLGCVLKGETRHDEVIAYTLADKISGLSLKYSKPVTLGVMGPGINKQQAEKRIGAYSKRAVEAVKKLAEELGR
jgi:6,7-dimethyl-8-ribityllumazine synthase